MQQVTVISDMELRNAFSLHCVRMETQLVHVYLELLSSVFNSMVSVQIQSHTEVSSLKIRKIPLNKLFLFTLLFFSP